MESAVSPCFDGYLKIALGGNNYVDPLCDYVGNFWDLIWIQSYICLSTINTMLYNSDTKCLAI